ncbi:MAG: HNH endonuclease, partial [Dehalococcoidia bacterium]|nr:HNH endonuclease [Dehalococcoidia bacterium]
MRGFVAVTDPGWYEHLSSTPGPRDANFWRPSTRAFGLDVGTPFFFKLKAPHHTIAGFGYFAGFSVLPDWLAWETFGEANGVASFADLRGRVARIQDGARIRPDASSRIGCCLVAEATFFRPDWWVRPPADWKRTTQVGAGYDLTAGEGARVWQECLERSMAGAAESGHDLPALREPDGLRYGTPTLHTPRLGQGIFRVHVLDAYGRACAVTGEHSL